MKMKIMSKITKNFNLEDIGIYHISLANDVDAMTSFVQQYSTPIFPKIDSENFIDYCYLSNGEIDESKVCYIFGIIDESLNIIQSLLIFSQHILSKFKDDVVNIGWVNCNEQSTFCSKLSLNPTSKNEIKLASLWTYNNKFQLFSQSITIDKYMQHILNNNNNDQNNDNNSNNNLLQSIVQWISNTMETSKNENNNNNIWKESDIPFPAQIKFWTDDLSNIFSSSFSTIFSSVTGGLSLGANAASTLLSYFIQFIVVIVFFFFLLPMVRGL